MFQHRIVYEQYTICSTTAVRVYILRSILQHVSALYEHHQEKYLRVLLAVLHHSSLQYC